MKSRIIEQKWQRIVIHFPDNTSVEQIKRAADTIRKSEGRGILLPVSWEVQFYPKFKFKYIIDWIVNWLKGYLYRKR